MNELKFWGYKQSEVIMLFLYLTYNNFPHKSIYDLRPSIREYCCENKYNKSNKIKAASNSESVLKARNVHHSRHWIYAKENKLLCLNYYISFDFIKTAYGDS